MDRLENHSSPRKKHRKHFIVVGGGWAGLTCAYRLAQQHHITLIEASPQLGGRARTFAYHDLYLDNGQHIATSSYKNLLGLFKELGLAEERYFQRLPLTLRFYHSEAPQRPMVFYLSSRYKLYHRLKNIWSTPFTWSEKKALHHLVSTCPPPEPQASALEYLLQHHQTFPVIKCLWEPLTLAIFATSLKHTAAVVFHHVLTTTAHAAPYDNDLLLPRQALSHILPEHLIHALKRAQARIMPHTRVTGLIGQQQISGVQTRHGPLYADGVILATPPAATRRLLTQAPLQSLAQQLDSFSYAPITTLYLMFARPLHLPYPMLGLLNHLSQWVFAHPHDHILAVVISGPSEADELDNPTLFQRVWQELRFYFHLDVAVDYKIIREKQAVFRCDVATHHTRPDSNTAYPNLWLTGDYVKNTYPATLEGTIFNGLRTAAHVQQAVMMMPQTLEVGNG